MSRVRLVRVLRILAFAISCSASFALQATDHWFYKAVIAWDKNQYTQARRLFMQSAKLGNIEACYNIGVIYQQGYGTRRNLRRAKYWFKRAARKGNSNAEFALARLIIAQRRKSAGDIINAKQWLTSAAHKRHAAAMYWLGTLYTMGQGVKIDHKRAAYWYIRAAKSGFASAQIHAARLYSRGIGVKLNIVTAYAWAKMAMLQGAAPARYNWLYIKKRMNKRQQNAGEILVQRLIYQQNSRRAHKN